MTKCEIKTAFFLCFYGPRQKRLYYKTAQRCTCKLLAMNSASKKFANAVDYTSLLNTTRPSKVLS